MNCEYCKSTFKNKHSLVLHQKRAKYCLNMRNKDITQEELDDLIKKFIQAVKDIDDQAISKYVTILRKHIPREMDLILD